MSKDETKKIKCWIMKLKKSTRKKQNIITNYKKKKPNIKRWYKKILKKN